MREWIQRYHQYQVTQDEYHKIPRFIGVDLGEGEEVQRVLNEAATLVEFGWAPDRKSALRMIAQERPEISGRTFMIAVNAERLRNPERRQFRLQNRDAFLMVEPIDPDTLRGII